MPIKIEIKVPSGDTVPASEFMMAVTPVLEQIRGALGRFAKDRIDFKMPLTDHDGQPCGELEVLRF